MMKLGNFIFINLLKKKLKNLLIGLNVEKIISKAHCGLIIKKGKPEYAPNIHEIQEEVNKILTKKRAMEFKTKFNIGNKVYFMCDNKIRHEIIKGISIFIGEKNDRLGGRISTKENIPNMEYCLSGINQSVYENDCYEEKEELIQSLCQV